MCAVNLLACVVARSAPMAEVPGSDVVLKSEIEMYGFSEGLTPVEESGASGGKAMALSAKGRAVGALPIKAGEYTLLVRSWAPSGDKDGFLIEIDGARARRKAAVRRWMTMAVPVAVAKDGALSLSIIGQEPGVVIDMLAIVRGRFGDDQLDISGLPFSGDVARRVGVEPIARLEFPCRLRELPGQQIAQPGEVYHEGFEGAVAGATGTTEMGPGKWGQALHVGVPDGRFEIGAEQLKRVGPVGTIEWWVRPRPAQRLWHDQGWHYFLHCRPTGAQGPRFDLMRHPLTGLQLGATCGEKAEQLKMDTSGAHLEEWHHLLVSWDFRSDHQCLWLLFDGAGAGHFFPRQFAAPAFSGVQFGNTPAGDDLPWLFMDGALDEVRISNVSVSERLAR